ncbi:Putative pyruvate, phosphate dikinase regulatory protein [Candidatus Fokinia solitaria]|uniref:Pyruvate, phosphate dikinase regulatory protein n=1 Tax=Candidatus Fokinia solitaria TaxID=1802984 RepID=A0A2U8BSK5_9RICK|nr:kinase/pyrophosphorylase [Candidatus Fokinia solitaria]AWD33329.1 Putative pyruvate, phosphate dikinase regulatory protein [Candidatus Fokinia solitaria]
MHIHLHLVSDSSGNTVKELGRAVITQFSDLKVDEYLWSFVRSVEKASDMLNTIDHSYENIVIYTIADDEVKRYLTDALKKKNIYSFSPIEEPSLKIQSIINKPARKNFGKSLLEEKHYDVAESVRFAIEHDDGTKIDDVENADIVLLGVSRSSKTPISFYLACKGYKVANIPIVLEYRDYIMNELRRIKYSTFIVGIDLDAQTIYQKRKHRFLMENTVQTTVKTLAYGNYTDISIINTEVKSARDIFRELDIDVINATYRGIEEISAEIISMFTYYANSTNFTKSSFITK